jgi:hypothetical protein
VPNAAITPAAGVGTVLGVFGLTNIPRSLYLYVNEGVQAIEVEARSLYLYVNEGYVATVAARALYLYRNSRDGEVFPYLASLSPTEQYEGGQVSLYGDGFGQYLDATDDAPTVTVSSTNGANVKDFATDRLTNEWQSTSDSGAWIRFTWGTAKRIVAILLEGSANGTSWGLPRFTFDDASQQDGSPTVPAANAAYQSSEYPVGGLRQVYWLATPKVSTYVDISIASGGSRRPCRPRPPRPRGRCSTSRCRPRWRWGSSPG